LGARTTAVKNAAIPTTAKAVQPGIGTSGRRVFPRQSGGDGRNADDEREAGRCSLGADRADVTGSSTRAADHAQPTFALC
jgi:hypothetical protein